MGTSFGLSILAATIRTTYRIVTQGRLLPDEFLLFFACVTLTAATSLLYVLIPLNYLDEKIKYSLEINVMEIAGLERELFDRAIRIRQLSYSYLALTWLTIFSVKMCFLLFFHQLIHCLGKLMLIWKIVFAITIFVFCFCIFGNFIACPHLGRNDARKSSSFAHHRSPYDTKS